MQKNEIALAQKMGLKNPGDNLWARITDTGRQVLKIETDNGKTKYSATHYPTTGTVVETRTTKTK